MNKMKNTMQSRINKKAWNIRRNAAQRFNCKIMEVSWKECLRMAKEDSIPYLDNVVQRHTAFDDFEDLLYVNNFYNPTFPISKSSDMLILANAFDKYCKAFGKPNRAHRV